MVALEVDAQLLLPGAVGNIRDGYGPVRRVFIDAGAGPGQGARPYGGLEGLCGTVCGFLRLAIALCGLGASNGCDLCVAMVDRLLRFQSLN